MRDTTELVLWVLSNLLHLQSARHSLHMLVCSKQTGATVHCADTVHKVGVMGVDCIMNVGVFYRVVRKRATNFFITCIKY